MTSAGIEYEELPGSPTFSGSRDGPKATRILKVAWSDKDALLGEFFPEAIETGKGWIFPVSAALPGNTALQALDYSVKPFDPDKTTGHDANGLRDYSDETGAEITINYGVPPYDPQKQDPTDQGNQILADRSMAFSAEMLRLGTPGWIWAADGEPIKNEDAALAKMVPTIEHTINWKFVPSPPFLKIAKMIGCINSDTVLFDAPAETLLFHGAETRRSYSTGGQQQSWDVTCKFLQRWVKDGAGTIIGWNHLFRNDVTPARWDRPRYWDEVTAPNTSLWEWATKGWKYLYPAIPFTGLFDRDTSDDTT